MARLWLWISYITQFDDRGNEAIWFFYDWPGDGDFGASGKETSRNGEGDTDNDNDGTAMSEEEIGSTKWREQCFQMMCKKYKDIVKSMLICGIKYSEIPSLTLCDVNEIADSFIDKRELEMNDSLHVMHNAASLIAMAVWGSDKFPKETPRIRLRPMSEEEYNEKLRQETENFVNMMRPLVEAQLKKKEGENKNG